MTDECDGDDDRANKGLSWRNLPNFFGLIVEALRGIWFLLRGLWWLAGLIAEAIRN